MKQFTLVTSAKYKIGRCSSSSGVHDWRHNSQLHNTARPRVHSIQIFRATRKCRVYDLITTRVTNRVRVRAVLEAYKRATDRSRSRDMTSTLE